MNYCEIKPVDIANGTGVRVSLFVSGCTHHCKGCFNAVTWDFNYGNMFTSEVENNIIELLKPNFIEGLTLLGGEPFEPQNQVVLVKFLKKVRDIFGNTKNIWCYSGYTFEELTINSRAKTENTIEMLSYIDVLVDGEFKLDQKDITLKFRGSKNQRIIDIKKSLEQNQIVLFMQ